MYTNKDALNIGNNLRQDKGDEFLPESFDITVDNFVTRFG